MPQTVDPERRGPRVSRRYLSECTCTKCSTKTSNKKILVPSHKIRNQAADSVLLLTQTDGVHTRASTQSMQPRMSRAEGRTTQESWRPRMTWRRTFAQDLQEVGIVCREAKDKIAHGDCWLPNTPNAVEGTNTDDANKTIFARPRPSGPEDNNTDTHTHTPV